MRERLILALRPWTYSEIGVLWFGLLALMALCVVVQARGRASAAHRLMAAAGAAITGKLAFDLVWHYGRCPACSVLFDVSPNPSSWAFLYDYVCCAVILAFFAFQEGRRFGVPLAKRWLVALAQLVAPLVAAPLFFDWLHAREAAADGPRPVPRWTWVYAVLVVVPAPFVMPAIPADHFGDLGGEFFWDGTSNRLNAYVGYAVLLLFGQVFLFTLPRTRGFWRQVAGLFLAFNNLAAFIALWLVFYDRRFASPKPERQAFALGGAAAAVAAIFAGNALAALFGVTLRTTEIVIKSPHVVCAEGLATRAHALRACLRDLEQALPERAARGERPGANGVERNLPDETRACIDLARSSIAAARVGDEKATRELTRRLGAHHGSDVPSCQEAASANYAVLNECPQL